MRTRIGVGPKARTASLDVRGVLGLGLFGVVVAACSGGSQSSGFALDGGGSTPTGPGVSSDGGPTTTPTGPVPVLGGVTDAGVAASPDAGATCTTTSTGDSDGDGWSPADGDCNDCNKFVNPGAYDIPGDGVDEDCSGKVDDEPTGCDSTLTSVATTAGEDGAKAMDLCRTTTETAPLAQKTWGVISADYMLPDGTTTTSAKYPVGLGILGPTFGTSNPTQQGVRMLGLSSGTARQPTDTGYQDVGGYDKGYTSGAPTGFPGQTPACGNVTFGKPHDGAALKVVLRVPTNALTMSLDSNFFSYEFPDYVCSTYNDTYVVIMTPAPAGEPTTANNNIAFDSKGNIVSVNAGFLQVCDTSVAPAGYTCPEGPSKLLGTGFGSDSALGENHASSDWLTTTVSVAALAGKDITLLFAIWDSSDGELDSTVLVDNVHWTFATLPNTPPPPVAPPVTAPK